MATNDPWVFLSTNYPAKTGTNWTTFTHSNIVVYPPPCGTNSGGGSGGPPGFEMMLANGETVLVTQDGEVLTKEDLLPNPWNPRFHRQAKAFDKNSAATMNSESSESEEPCPFATNSIGFYRVVRTGVYLLGITNGMTLSGILQIPVEVGNNTGALTSVSLGANGKAIEGTPMLSDPFPHPYLYLTVDTRRLNNGSYSLPGDCQLERR